MLCRITVLVLLISAAIACHRPGSGHKGESHKKDISFGRPDLLPDKILPYDGGNDVDYDYDVDEPEYEQPRMMRKDNKAMVRMVVRHSPQKIRSILNCIMNVMFRPFDSTVTFESCCAFDILDRVPYCKYLKDAMEPKPKPKPKPEPGTPIQPEGPPPNTPKRPGRSQLEFLEEKEEKSPRKLSRTKPKHSRKDDIQMPYKAGASGPTLSEEDVIKPSKLSFAKHPNVKDDEEDFVME